MKKTEAVEIPAPAEVLPYATEEREHHLALLQQLRRKRHQGRDLVPKSLLKAAQGGNVINLRQDLKALLQAEYKSPVISLYLRLTADKVAPEPKALVRSFRSMKAQELKRREDFVAALPKTVSELLTYDLEEIETFLADYFVPHGAHSLVIFKSGEDLNRVIAPSVRTRDVLTIDPNPYIVPLESVLEEEKRVLFLELMKKESRFLVYDLGDCFEVDRIQSFVPSDRVDKSIPGHAQQHRLTHLEWHLKATAQRAERLYHEESCQAAILAADERLVHMLEGYLPEAMRTRIIGRISGSPAADPRDRREVIESVLRDFREGTEAAAIREVQEYVPREEVVCGLTQVIEALNLFLVRKLIIGESLRQSGFVCRQHHFLSLGHGSCPFCAQPLLPVEDFVDEVVKIARVHGVNVTMVEFREDLLAAYQGIAAILYPNTASAVASA